MRSLVILGILLPLMGSTAYSQRCATAIEPARAEAFQKWIQGPRLGTMSTMSRQSEEIRIPVIFHVILTQAQMMAFDDAQVASQMVILNADYQRLNADTILTLPDFSKVAGRLKITFVLASKDPGGNEMSTPGIERINTRQTGYDLKLNDGRDYKLLSSWDSKKYLNIWVVNSIDATLGASSWPDFALPGLPSPLDPALDGVTIDYGFVGNTADPTYNKGRTLTHEIGHYFGLVHIFGDEVSGCQTTDYVDDTPTQPKHTASRPLSPPTACGVATMYQNYMDYTPDDQLNLFTAGQVSRMMIVLMNARNGLINNDATVSTIGSRITGVEPPAAKNFVLYRTGKTLTVTLSPPLEEAEVTLYSITGQVIHSSRGSQEIDLSGCSPGVYLVIISGSSQKHVTRILN